MEQRGLTSSVLRDEIDRIENRANSDTRMKGGDLLCTISSIGFIVFVVGCVLVGIWIDCSIEWNSDKDCGTGISAWVCFVVGFIVWFRYICVDRYRRDKAVNNALDNIRNYVEIDLNEKYQKTMGIRWSILTDTKPDIF